MLDIGAGALRILVLPDKFGELGSHAMRVPKRISVGVTSIDAVDLGSLIVQITIDPGHRNPYRILLPKTDSAGKSEINRDEFIGQFDDHLEIGLMDHAGPLHRLRPTVDMSLFDDSWWRENKGLALEWPLLTHESRIWSSRQQHYDYITSSNNRAFECRPARVNLHETAIVQLAVTIRA